MTTRRQSSKAVRTKTDKRDLQVEEFESRDLAEDVRAAGRLRPIRKTLPSRRWRRATRIVRGGNNSERILLEKVDPDFP